MKLKTLKDLKEDKIFMNFGLDHALHIIEQEVIKHIKNLREHHKNREECVGYCLECVDAEHPVDWIKTFFNITEEYLK